MTWPVVNSKRTLRQQRPAWQDATWWREHGPHLLLWARQFDLNGARIATALGVKRQTVHCWTRGMNPVGRKYRGPLLSLLWECFFP